MTIRTVLFSSLVAGALGGAVLVLAGPQPAFALEARSDQDAIVRSFRSVLKRDPQPKEMRRYALLTRDYGWTEQDIRSDLRGRSDYRRHSTSSQSDTNAIITRAYEDILGREPDSAGLRSQRTRMVKEGWSERDVREDLRRRPEYRSTTRRSTSADRIVRRAYQDILNREPDPGGLSNYRRAIIEDGWDEQDVRQVLLRSDEYRGLQRGDDGRTRQRSDDGRGTQGSDERRGMQGSDEQRGRQGAGTAVRGQDQVTQIVRNAYLAILRREPDANGLHDYGARVERDNWTQADVEKALLDSQEYRSKNR